MEQIKLEHYKALKQEHQYYLTQVQQLWLFKLTTLGVVLAVGVLSDRINSLGAIDKSTIIALSLISLPVVSFIIDLKVLEYSLHIKAISKHIIQHFAEEIEIHSWEERLWSKNPLTKQRTYLTIFSSVGLSILILLIAFYFAYLLQPIWLIPLIFTAVSGLLVLLLCSLFIIPNLLK
jgi:hypothetical protein